MDYNKVGKRILQLLGGEKNVESAAHCATRLRLVIKDDKKVDKKSIEAMDEVKGVFTSAGQFQIIIGQGAVNKVFAEMVKGTKIESGSVGDAKKAAMKNMNPLQRFARVLSNIFVPIIPAIVASGLLMGFLGMGTRFGWFASDSAVFTFLDMFSNAAFIFLPILIAFSAAKEFGANPYLAATLGGILIHPALQNAWTVGGGIEKSITFLGMNVDMVGYQGTVLPILIAVWAMGYIERWVRKVVPNMLDIILTPFITLMISGLFALIVIGPAGRLIGDGISFGLEALYNGTGVFSGLLFGGLYSSIVITGIHHSFHAIEAGLLSNPDIAVNFLLPIWAMANVAQGGAALAVGFKTKSKKIKAIAAPASLSCLLGITEAAIFGVNLRFVKPFIAAAIGGALGGGYVVLTKVYMTAVGVTGIPGTAIVQPGSMVNYIIGMIIAFGGAFAMTYILGFKDEVEEDKKKLTEPIKVQELIEKDLIDGEVILAPVKGEIVSIEEVPDMTFSEKLLGDGIAIKPTEGVLYAPLDGVVMQVFDTKHAVAMKSNSGMELLIHVGLETVKMNGEGFKAFVQKGDSVKAGDKILEFDLKLIEEKAKSAITPVVITNTDEYETIRAIKRGSISCREEILTVIK